MADTVNDIDFGKLPLFSGLNRLEIAKIIPSLITHHFATDEVLFRQGEEGDSLHIIVTGMVRVIREEADGTEREIALLSHGQCVGEMALLSGEPRSATVSAASDLTTLRLAKENFDELIHRHHSLSVHFAGVLASRLFNATAAQKAAVYSADDEAETSVVLGELGFLSNKKFLTIALGVILCSLAALVMDSMGFSSHHILIGNLLLAATIIWTFDAVPFHAVSISLPVFAVLFGISSPERAFSGFSKPYWFLALGVFALSAAIFRTGLLYRLALHIMRIFPPSYLGQTFALALSGFALTPMIPSAYARSILASPIALTMSETMHLKKGSPATVGIAMACLLGFGHMSFVFLNGTASCAFVLGLMPEGIQRTVNWDTWLLAALPLGIVFFLLSFGAIALLFHPKQLARLQIDVVDAQLKTLGPITTKEKIAMATILISIFGFATEHWHHVNEAWIAMIGFIIVFATQVIDEQSIRSDIDWSYLISLGAMVGFGDILTDSGFDQMLIGAIKPYMELFISSKMLFLVIFSITVHLIRCALPLTPGLLVSMLAVMPILTSIGINPLVSGLVALASANPWMLKQSNSIFRNVWKSSGSKLFHHEDAMKMAFLHIAIVAIAVVVSVPYWIWLGLIR
jgi:branched-chain amino acid transport system substrate-binding protein